MDSKPSILQNDDRSLHYLIWPKTISTKHINKTHVLKIICRLDKYKKLEQLFPPVAHPVVRTHNVTGVKSLYVNRTFATHLENQDQELYNFLADKASVPEYQIRFKWKSIGDIAMWDNRVLQHYAVNDYQGKDRLMEHTASLGEKVF